MLLSTKRCGFVVFFLVVSCAVCCANFCDQIIGKLCTFCVLFAWESCEVCCAIFCDQIIREVVFFLGVLLLMKLWVGAKYKIN